MISAEATLRSIWTIWPIFSSNVIRERRSFTLKLTGTFGSLYFTYSASAILEHSNSRKNPTWGVKIFPIFYCLVSSVAFALQSEVSQQGKKTPEKGRLNKNKASSSDLNLVQQ